MKTSDHTFPPGLNNAYWFATFNALSFQIVLSSPMVLYAKSIGATATVLGIIAGMMPLLVIFQIPAAQYVDRVGYKRFVYAGWGTRVAFIFVMALVPLMGRFLDRTSLLALILMLLFVFNLSRGISSAAWLPWIASLVPEPVRGRFLARDAAAVNLASFVSFLFSAWVLGSNPAAWQFAALIGFSAVTGAISLVFLKRIPDATPPEHVRSSNTPVPYREISRYPPFRKLLKMVMVWSMAYGGIGAFTVAFLKTEAGMSEGRILLVSSVFFIGGLCSLWFLGSRLDALGSKPVLIFSLITWLVVVIGWWWLAARPSETSLGLILGLQFFMGLCAALVNIANTRLAMIIIPPMGRSHFLALFSVVANVSLGLAPILWGLLIDVIGPRHVVRAGLDWNRYSVFFAGAAMVFVIALIRARRLVESRAVSMEVLLREILIELPQRALGRLWPKGW